MKNHNQLLGPSVEQKFIIKPWDESIDRSALLDIMNAHFKYLTSEYYVETTKEVFDRIFGNASNLTRDLLIFKSEAGKVVGFTGVSSISGAASSWRLVFAILPEYFETSLPQQLIEASISLGHTLKIETLTLYTLGSLAAPFDQVLKNLTYHPRFVLLEMHLTVFRAEHSTPLPRGVIVRSQEEVHNYDQYVTVLNEAFRPVSGFQPTTIEKMRNIHEYRKKQRAVEFILAHSNGLLVGFCHIEFDFKEKAGYGFSLAVHPNYQHQGIGRYLAIEGIKHLRSKHCKRIELVVVLNNETAVKMYDNLGFHSIEKMTRRCYRISTK
jgi:mycothiol synthase